jgi:hypothetical protein
MELPHHRFRDLGRLGHGAGVSLARTLPFRPGPADWAQAGLVGLALFALYAATAPRTVALEDDGLFILSSYFLGIEHPPGYPLFTLLGKLATLVPVGSVAYRVHLLSGLFGGLTGAAVWLCARALLQPRLLAYLAALGLGVSPVFWSQALIAEVYTLNTFFLFGLVYLGLTRGPLPAMALTFGLSLSNHWPLMLLAAPALLILLWPRRQELLRRLPLLAALFTAGLLPYAWMVVLSWAPRPISFNGPLESLAEVWHFLSRSGYAEVDSSPSASWWDRARFFRFLGAELARQFALAGTVLAAIGFVRQWREWGTRIALSLSVAFAMPTVVLLLLLNFDYDSLHKHLFHVYPLPAYGVAALWMGLGAGWAVQRLQLTPASAAAGGVVLVAAIAAVGSRSNLLADYDWAERYAKAVLQSVPKDATVFVQGDPDLNPIAYFHMVEGWRPDITLYQPLGLILGNRLFHPLRTDAATVKAHVRARIDQDPNPVVYTLGPPQGYAQRDRWLHVELDRRASDPKALAVELSDEAMRFAEESLLEHVDNNAYAVYIQGQLRRHYGRLLARLLVERARPDARMERHLRLLENDFYGALGVAEGLLSLGKGASAEAVRYLERARDRMPADASKHYQARFFEVRAYVRMEGGDRGGARRDLESALAVWPVRENGAITALEDLYRQAGNEKALSAMRASLKR